MQTIGRRMAARIDEAAMQELGLPRAVLMENAARAVADVALQLASELGSPVRFIVLCGKGRNGGDGYAAARLLATGGAEVRICETDPGACTDEDTRGNREAARRIGIPFCGPDGFDRIVVGRSLVLIDAIFGTGFRATALPENVQSLTGRIRELRSPDCRVLSVDIASGTDCDTGRTVPGTIEADLTLAFVLPKTGSVAMPGLLCAGRIRTTPIGFPLDALLPMIDTSAIGEAGAPVWADDAWTGTFAPLRPRDAHKGGFGRVLVCGGAPGTPGAACMAAEAAGRSGAGRIWAIVPESILPICVAALPETMWRGVDPLHPDGAASTFTALLEGKDACAIGPGLGSGPFASALVEAALRSSVPLVVDADALRCIAGAPDRFLPLIVARHTLEAAPVVVTPHGGEFEALAAAAGVPVDHASPLESALALAIRLSCIVVRKGHGTVVADGSGRAWLNTTGGDGLAKGGSGDLLCGLLAGLLAQGIPAAEAAACAVHLHGLAGDLATERLGVRSMLPRDLLDDLPGAYRRCGWEPETGVGKEGCAHA